MSRHTVEHGLSSEQYSTEEAATRLGISPATVKFWEDRFRDELQVPRDWKGEPQFSSDHLTQIQKIQRMLLAEDNSLDQVRQTLRHVAAARDWDPISKELTSPAAAPDQPGRTADSSPLGNERPPTEETALTDTATVEESLIVGPTTASDTASPSEDQSPEESYDRQALEEEIAHLRSAVDELNENVAFLLEENQAMQVLLGRLIEHLEQRDLSTTVEEHGDEEVDASQPEGTEDEVGADAYNDPFARDRSHDDTGNSECEPPHERAVEGLSEFGEEQERKREVNVVSNFRRLPKPLTIRDWYPRDLAYPRHRTNRPRQ